MKLFNIGDNERRPPTSEKFRRKYLTALLIINIMPFLVSISGLFCIFALSVIVTRAIGGRRVNNSKLNKILDGIYVWMRNYKKQFLFSALIRSSMQAAFEIFLWIFLSLEISKGMLGSTVWLVNGVFTFIFLGIAILLV